MFGWKLIWCIFALLILILLVVCMLLSKEASVYISTSRWSTSYMCGFDEESKLMEPMAIKYSLIALLFLIFDLEMLFLIPGLTACTLFTSSIQLVTMVCNVLYLFIFILYIGLWYEYQSL